GTAFSPAKDATLIGRERHLAALNEAFQQTKQGRAVVVYVEGRSGMGKSILVHHFLEQLRSLEQEVVILSGRCYEQESVPYKAFDSVVDALSRYLKHLPTVEAEVFLPNDVLTLARLFPVLRQIEAVAKARPKVLDISDPQELRCRAFGSLLEL